MSEMRSKQRDKIYVYRKYLDILELGVKPFLKLSINKVIVKIVADFYFIRLLNLPQPALYSQRLLKRGLWLFVVA
jgi:hypothetical protein